MQARTICFKFLVCLFVFLSDTSCTWRYARAHRQWCHWVFWVFCISYTLTHVTRPGLIRLRPMTSWARAILMPFQLCLWWWSVMIYALHFESRICCSCFESQPEWEQDWWVRVGGSLRTTEQCAGRGSCCCGQACQNTDFILLLLLQCYFF